MRGKAGDDAGAMTAGKEAAAKFSQAWKLANYDPRLRPQAEEACLALARIAIQSGNHAELAELGQSRAALRPECGEELLVAAKFLAAAAALAARDENLSSEQRRQRADGYAAQGIDLVRRAVAQGFRDERRLRTDGDLVPLRERAEFQELLENVSGKR